MKTINLKEATLDQLIDDYNYEKHLAQIEREIIVMILLSSTNTEKCKIINMLTSNAIPCIGCEHDCYTTGKMPPKDCPKIDFTKGLIKDIEIDLELFKTEKSFKLKKTA